MSALNDLRSYSRHWLTEFIETYKNEECLWQAKHPDYSNHVIRNLAYDKLVEKLKEVEPNPDRAMVVRKINSLRSAFRREYRKTSSKINYETRLWYFDKLLFIACQNSKHLFGTPRKEIKINFEDDDSIVFEHEEDSGKNYQICDNSDLMSEICNHDIKTECSSSTSTSQQHQQQESSTASVNVLEITTIDSNSQREIQQAVNSLEQHRQQQMHQLQHVNQSQSVAQIHQVPTIQISREHMPTLFNSATYETTRPSDEYDAIGINISSKLRIMNSTQRIIAEKLISDVLFNGQLSSLNISSRLTDC